MKKYVKPELFYERYELSQHIADCAWEFKTQSEAESCKAVSDPDFYGGLTVTVFTADACQLTPDQCEMYCYQNSQDMDFPHFDS